MSWKRAQDEADKWLRGLGYDHTVSGRHIDLSEKGDTLQVTGGFRLMVLRAVDRWMTKRGATVTLPQ